MNFGVRLLFVILSAGLGILVFPPVGWAAFAVVAWLPLLFALRECKTSHAFYLGLLHGILFFAVTMAWLVNVFKQTPHLVIPLVLIMALFTAFFARGYVVAQQRYGPGWITALFASCWWLAMEFYRSEIFYLKFPWMTPGVGLGPTCISPLLGVYGVSFLLVLAAALVCQRTRHCITGAVLLLFLSGSMIVQKNKPLPEHTGVNVLAVQSEVADIDNYIKLTRSGLAVVKPDIILWPEYALPFDVRRNVRQSQQLLDLAQETDSILVVGTQTSMEENGWRNTALSISKNGYIGEHYKNHTVHFFDDGTAGTEAKAVDTGEWKIGTPICFDCDYQDVIRRMTADGAQFFTIPSMDAIHWGEQEHYQHAELFRHRAAENGRWIVVAATSGVTQIIDSNGNRVKSIPIIEEGILAAEIGHNDRLTVYTRIGWVFPWVVMVIGAFWMIVIFIQELLERRQARDTRIA